MDSDINAWQSCLNELDSRDKVDKHILKKLAAIVEHLPSQHQVAPRLLRDYNSCTSKLGQILSDLFDKVDISDKNLFTSLLKLSKSYGEFKLAQIVFHIESPRDHIDPDLNYNPILTKTKWYDLTPLLPSAGSLGWKHLLIHGMVDERDFSQPGLQLLVQKLRFYGAISTIDRFANSLDVIQKNGERVAEKLVERLLDFANDDEVPMGLNQYLFNLLLPFTTHEQQAALIEAIVRDRFKARILEESGSSTILRDIGDMIGRCMDYRHLQEVLIVKLLEHLKVNVIRRKRRHSVEASEEQLDVTLESLISEIVESNDPMELLDKTHQLEISSKHLQTSYLTHWTDLLISSLNKKTLSPTTSTMILSTCSVILITTSSIISEDLTTRLSILMAKTIDNTGHRKLEKFFRVCGANYLVKLTTLLADKTELLDDFDTPMRMFFKSYFARHMRFCAMKGYHKDAEKFSQFIEFICTTKDINKDKSHLLEYICLCELSEFLDNLKGKGGNKMLELYVDYSKSIGNKLYKFIKHNFKANESEETSNGTNGNGSKSDYQKAVVDALVCILKIAIDRKEQDLLDNFGDMMSKLYNQMCSRFEKLTDKIKTGSHTSANSLDPHLPRLMSLYIDHRAMIEPYLCFDLNEKIANLLIFPETTESTLNEGLGKSRKKASYQDVKTKIEELQKRSAQSKNVYQSIINKQYNPVVDPAIGGNENLEKEDYCCRKYMNHMKYINEVSVVLLNNCDTDLYKLVLENIVRELEQCDSLDHPKILYLLMVVKSIIPRHTKETLNFTAFKDNLPRISCALIRISKSVELGPSIHSFTRPGTHKSSAGIQCCTYSNCIEIYSLIFTKFPHKITNTLITEAMQLCVCANLERYARYSTRIHKFFIQLASAISGMLKAICIGGKEEDALKSSIPMFLSMFSLLIRCIMMASDRRKHLGEHQTVGKEDITTENSNTSANNDAHLEHLARDIGRLMNNLSFLEVKLVDYAPHLISTYIKDTQQASCPDSIKKHLDEGIFRIFNVVDAHQKNRQEKIIEAGIQRKTNAGKASGSLFEMIHARLDQASREIFRDMHENYNKFHRYLGKC